MFPSRAEEIQRHQAKNGQIDDLQRNTGDDDLVSDSKGLEIDWSLIGGGCVDASDIDFLPFSDLEQSVRDDIEVVRSSPLIPNDVEVAGFVYDVKTGRLTEVA